MGLMQSFLEYKFLFVVDLEHQKIMHKNSTEQTQTQTQTHEH